jgi:transposase
VGRRTLRAARSFRHVGLDVGLDVDREVGRGAWGVGGAYPVGSDAPRSSCTFASAILMSISSRFALMSSRSWYLTSWVDQGFRSTFSSIGNGGSPLAMSGTTGVLSRPSIEMTPNSKRALAQFLARGIEDRFAFGCEAAEDQDRLGGDRLFSKRLEAGRFCWPSPAEGVVRLSAAQLATLLEGLPWHRLQPRAVPRPSTAW